MDFKKFLKDTVSRMATAAAQTNDPKPQLKARKRTVRDELAEDKLLTRAQRRAKYGRKRGPFARVLVLQRHGPFLRPLGHTPRLTPFFEWHVLHATKGWRVYHNRVPNAIG